MSDKKFMKEFENGFQNYFDRLNRRLFAILRKEKFLYDPVSRVHDKRKAGQPHLRDSWVRKTRRRNGFYMTPKRHDIKLRVDNTSIPYNVYTSGVGNIKIVPKEKKTLLFYSPYWNQFVSRKSVQLNYDKYHDGISNMIITAASKAISDVGKYNLKIDTIKSVRELYLFMEELERLK